MAADAIDITNRFFAAMQTGATAENEMIGLFADDAVYVEPFTGKVRTHNGKDAIRATMRDAWKRPMPDVRIEIDRIDVSGDSVRARWTCYSSTLPGGKGSGENLFTLRDGKITRLETSLKK